MKEATIEFTACGKTELEYGCNLSVENNRLVVKLPEEPQYSWTISLAPVKELVKSEEERKSEVSPPC